MEPKNVIKGPPSVALLKYSSTTFIMVSDLALLRKVSLEPR